MSEQKEILDAKPWWQSRGVIGSAVGIAVSVAVACGVQLPDGFGDQAAEVVFGISGAIAGAVALWGRIKAQKAIK
jgi:hypothetical protein